MCGIAGIIFKEQPTAKRLQQAKGIFTRLLGHNQVRGHFATGAGVVRHDAEPIVCKEALAAYDFIKGTAYRNALDEATPENVVALLGHTRWPTQGALTYPNNQPILYDRIIGVHNGHISNDDSIFQTLGADRRAQVDSEAVFAAAHHLFDGPTCKARAEKGQELGNLLQGRATVVLMDYTRPSEFLVLKKFNPISLVYVPSLGAFVYTSLEEHMNKVLARTPRQSLHIGEHTMSLVDMSKDKVFRAGLTAPESEYRTGLTCA